MRSTLPRSCDTCGAREHESRILGNIGAVRRDGA